MTEQDHPCKHRGGPREEEGRFACALVPERIDAPRGVRLEDCATCFYRDKDVQPLPAPVRPTFAERARNFLVAMKDELAWRAGGGAGPTEEEKAARRTACDSCDQRNPETDGCELCGCFLEAALLALPPRPLGKLDCSTQKCPADKWGYCGGYKPPEPRKCCGGG